MMETRTEQGYLLLADISGYTPFMAGTELEHSQPILADFLTLIINGLTPALSLAEVEGDAIFVYSSDAAFRRGETLLEIIETIYISFRDRKENMCLQTTCTCSACRKIPTLDLKFVAHYGKYALQSIGGKQKPVGSDVNLVHRLLKNSLKEKTGWQAYALFTDQCLEEMKVQPDSMHRQSDTYEHLGEVNSCSMDLDAHYLHFKNQRRIMIGPDESFYSVTQDVKAPPTTVWEWMTELSKRELYMKGTKWTSAGRSKGRTGVGSSNHCAHGGGVAIETILDWRPFEYSTTESVFGFLKMRMTDRLEQTATGTRVQCFARLENAWPQWMARPFVRFMMKMNKITQNYRLMAQLIEESESKNAAA